MLGNTGHIGTGVFPQIRQVFFARALGAREILAIRWWGSAAEKRTLCEKTLLAHFEC